MNRRQLTQGRRRCAADRNQPGYPGGPRHHYWPTPRHAGGRTKCTNPGPGLARYQWTNALWERYCGSDDTLVALRVDIVGLNCSTGPEHMREPVRFLAENCPLPISTIPNAGIPLNVNGLGGLSNGTGADGCGPARIYQRIRRQYHRRLLWKQPRASA